MICDHELLKAVIETVESGHQITFRKPLLAGHIEFKIDSIQINGAFTRTCVLRDFKDIYHEITLSRVKLELEISKSMKVTTEEEK
jgi:hypothetical protein